MTAVLCAFASFSAEAHEPAGTPDRFCTGPTNLHDYGPPSTSPRAGRIEDGPAALSAGLNVIVALDGSSLSSLTSPACDAGGEPTLQKGCLPLTWNTDFCKDSELCNLYGCLLYDGEKEYGFGGAVLASEDPWASQCWQVPAHHLVSNSQVYVQDNQLGGNVAFAVVTDWPMTGSDADYPCGDGIADACDSTNPADIPDLTCNPREYFVAYPPAGVGSALNQGQVTISQAGIDGVFHVLVTGGTAGHIWT